jgi:two-component system invasion response regulator UvrY
MDKFPNISVLLVDDHAMIRKACRDLLQRAGVSRIWEAADGEEAYRSYLEHDPDMVVLDLSMAKSSGFDTLRRIGARSPSARTVVFSMHDDPLFASRALRAGASGYVTKTSPPEELVTAIRTALGGGRHISHDVAIALVNAGLMNEKNPLEALTPREFEIFRLTVQGRSTGEIGDALSITAKSVSNAIGRLRDKLGVRSSAELVRLAIAHGIIEAGTGGSSATPPG